LKKSGSSCTLLYTAHEHVLRGMVKYLTGIDNEQVLSLRIPNAAPFIFEFDSNMKMLRNYYLDNEDVSVVDSVKKESKDI
jgi:2,3-bisphosphoglycerate-dependent phosphoglycerate mutase